MPNLPAFARPLLASATGLALAATGLPALAQTAPLTTPAASAPAQASAGGFQGGGRQGGQGGGRGQAQAGSAPAAGGPGSGRRGAAAPAAVAVPSDPLAEAFRAEVSAVIGEAGHMQALLVENLGWMRTTRTLAIGGEYKQGWTLASLTASKAVLRKAGSADKQIDLSRWSGPVSARTATAPTRNQVTQVSMGSLGMPSGTASAAQGAATAGAAQGAERAGAGGTAPGGQAGGGAAGQNANAGRRGGPQGPAADQILAPAGDPGQAALFALGAALPAE